MSVGAKVVAIIQARMGSNRLPGKVLVDLAGKPMLHRVVERVRAARLISHVVVATTTKEFDDEIATLCDLLGVAMYRGSTEDVLDRYYHAARRFGADVVVRVTADCPFIDPQVIDTVIRAYFEADCDYASNADPVATYPDGLDVWVFSRRALERAWAAARLRSEREHVTPYMFKHPEIFHIVSVRNQKDLSHLRWTVDEPHDLQLARELYGVLGDRMFGLADVLHVISKHPELLSINAGIARNEGYQKSLREDMQVGR